MRLTSSCLAAQRPAPLLAPENFFDKPDADESVEETAELLPDRRPL
jgi:hypothetical protein